jgi:hypothetical protein
MKGGDNMDTPKFHPANKTVREIIDAEIEQPKLEDLVPDEGEILGIVKSHSSALQFKNSLKYIQGGTNVNLERMIDRFDIVLAQVYLEGVQKGIAISKGVVGQKL